MDRLSGIYKIVHKESGKCYVGLSVNIKNRWKSHKSFAKPDGRRSAIYNAMRKYGVDAFEFEVLEYCDKEVLEEKERFWIKNLDSVNSGYNLTWGGESNKDVSEETRKKLSVAKKGIKQTQETIEKRAAKIRGLKRTPEQNAAKSALMKGRGIGRKLSAEHIEVLKTNFLGRKHSEESKLKMSQSKQGTVFSDDHRAKLSESHKGYKFSDERKAKHSEALKRYWQQHKEQKAKNERI